MTQFDDSNIPLLTEVVTPGKPIHDLELTPASPPEFDWKTLEQHVSERVLNQLQSRIDFVLEHRVRDNLADVLQIAVDQLTGQIRSGLQATLKEVISRALTQEIERLKARKEP